MRPSSSSERSIVADAAEALIASAPQRNTGHSPRSWACALGRQSIRQHCVKRAGRSSAGCLRPRRVLSHDVAERAAVPHTVPTLVVFDRRDVVRIPVRALPLSGHVPGDPRADRVDCVAAGPSGRQAGGRVRDDRGAQVRPRAVKRPGGADGRAGSTRRCNRKEDECAP